MKGRAVVERWADGVRVKISPERTPLLLAAHGAFVGVLAVAGVYLLASGVEDVLYLVSWALAFFVALLALAQPLFGREVVATWDYELILETPTWPWRYKKRFAAARVERLRLEPAAPPTVPEMQAFSNGSVAFEYDGSTYRFGVKLDESEGERLVALLADELWLRPRARAPEPA